MAILIVRLLAPGNSSRHYSEKSICGLSKNNLHSALQKFGRKKKPSASFWPASRPGWASSANAGVVAKEQRGAGDDFADQTARLLTTHRSLLQKSMAPVNDAARRRLLADLRQALRSFKDLVGAPGIASKRQLTSALKVCSSNSRTKLAMSRVPRCEPSAGGGLVGNCVSRVCPRIF